MTPKRGHRSRKSKKPRMKNPDSSDSTVSNRKPRPPLQGLNQTSWSPSEASQSAFNVSYPSMVPTYPLYPPATTAPAQTPQAAPSLATTAFGEAQGVQVSPAATTAFPAPIMVPTWALLMPNYVFSQFGQVQPAFAPQQPFQPQQSPFAMQPHQPFGSTPPFNVQAQFAPQQPFQPTPTPFTSAPTFPVPPQFVPQTHFPFSIATETSKLVPREGAASRSSTPPYGAREPTTSPPLFESRCSSPLQLNLLSMEEGHRSMERQDSTVLSTSNGPTPSGQGAAKPDQVSH